MLLAQLEEMGWMMEGAPVLLVVALVEEPLSIDHVLLIVRDLLLIPLPWRVFRQKVNPLMRRKMFRKFYFASFTLIVSHQIPYLCFVLIGLEASLLAMLLVKGFCSSLVLLTFYKVTG